MRRDTHCELGRIYIKTYSELYKHIYSSLKRVKKTRKTSYKTLLKKKIHYSYEIMISELGALYRAVKTINTCGEFHRELFKVYTSEDIESYISLAKRRIHQARVVYREIMREIESQEEQHIRLINSAFRKGLGRLLSIYKRTNSRIKQVKEYLKEASKIPDIRGDYVIVLAGLPQVGKSTLLSKLTTAKPEIGVYPFTTKTIIAGHCDLGLTGRVVILDLPGILDSPIEEKNIIEHRAILAIKHLADHAFYIFASHPGFYYTLDEQVNVYNTVTRLLSGKKITVLLNKVDLLSSEEVNKLIEEIKARIGVEPIPISAQAGLNIDRVLEVITESFKEKTQYH
ncbi:MAG: GTPase [Desulfurococcaceae archaeon]